MGAGHKKKTRKEVPEIKSTNKIIVNPVGKESLDHITPKFIQGLLAAHQEHDVVFRFGTKMYSLQENINFRTSMKSGYVSGRLDQDGAWETHTKKEGFSMLLDNLKGKIEEAVQKYVARRICTPFRDGHVLDSSNLRISGGRSDVQKDYSGRFQCIS